MSDVIFGLIGAGGFAREVMPIVEHRVRIWHGSENDSETIFVLEDDYFIPSKEINGHRVMSMTNFLSAPASERRFNSAIGNSYIPAAVDVDSVTVCINFDIIDCHIVHPGCQNTKMTAHEK